LAAYRDRKQLNKQLTAKTNLATNRTYTLKNQNIMQNQIENLLNEARLPFALSEVPQLKEELFFLIENGIESELPKSTLLAGSFFLSFAHHD
jgi:hypothetical protein